MTGRRRNGFCNFRRLQQLASAERCQAFFEKLILVLAYFHLTVLLLHGSYFSREEN